MINYDILIDMKKSGCIDTGYELSQGDKELVEFNVILKNGSAKYTPEGDSTIVFKKANNTTESGALIPDGNKFNYKIKGSELSVPGPVLAEIKTYDSETGRASSSRFKFWVKPDLAEYDTTETGTYIGELEHKIIEANALIDQLTQSRDEALVMIEELGVGNFINVNKIVNTTAVTEAGFIPDALLVKDNALAIDTLTNNLTNISSSLFKAFLNLVNNDCNQTTTSGFYLTPSSGVVNLPTGWTQGRNILIVFNPTNADYTVQMIFQYGSGKFATRVGVTQAWVDRS